MSLGADDYIIKEPEEDSLFSNTNHDEDDLDIDDGEKKDKELEELKSQLKETNERIEQQNKLLLDQMQPEENVEDLGVNIPEKPKEFNIEDAYSKPTSESFVYRLKMEDAKRQYDNQEMLKNVAALVDEKIDLNSRVTKVQEMENDLVAKRKLDEDQMKKFKDFLSTQKSLTMEEMHDVFLKREGITPPHGSEITNEDNSIPQFNEFTGAPTKVPDDNLQFEEGLLTNIKGSLSKLK